MQRTASADARRIVHLIKASGGPDDPKAPLSALFLSPCCLDQLDWLLLVVAIEIDTRVEIPGSLIRARSMSIEHFANRVAALPKIARETHTLEMLSLVSQALLGSSDMDQLAALKQSTTQAAASKARAAHRLNKLSAKRTSKETRGTKSGTRRASNEPRKRPSRVSKG